MWNHQWSQVNIANIVMPSMAHTADTTIHQVDLGISPRSVVSIVNLNNIQEILVLVLQWLKHLLVTFSLYSNPAMCSCPTRISLQLQILAIDQ
jgi:hypothetical protein